MTEFLRILKPGTDKLPPGSRLPEWPAFQPSSEDERDAVTRAHPIRVSVWSREETTIAQAKSMMNALDTARAFELSDEDVEAVGTATARTMQVVADPMTALQGQAGADGHSGIEGCDRPAGEPKTIWKDRLLRLAQRCRDVSDHPEE